ncbi:hypothetical protein [Snodgrassella sp. CFCC 13594]|uniref:hypothetical protein n=1 Tax=Snodgrassella sp. CFCC 13594 TaxID=1775559 RepID=UPI00082CECA6|nr:hypothetical protein [Snodgrassella sp. CFCC 13594]
MSSLHILAKGQWLNTTNLDSALKLHLKQYAPKTLRRSSRFTQLTMAGVVSLQPQSSSCGVYLGSRFSSPSTISNMLERTLTNNYPRPFDLIAGLHNAAIFQVANHFQLHGPTVFIATGSMHSQQANPLLLAFNDITAGKTTEALVGWAYEHQIHDNDATPEGSLWLHLIASRCNSSKPLGRINIVGPTPTTSTTLWQNFGNVSNWFMQQPAQIRLNTSLPQHLLQLTWQKNDKDTHA